MSDTATLPRRVKALDIIAERFDLNGRRVVDVGCGEGGLVRALTGLGAKVTGVECGAGMLERARGAEPAGDETYVEGVGQALPIPDGSVEVVVFMNSLHHVPMGNMTAALREAARVLAPGGVALVNEPLPVGSFFQVTRLVEDETEVRAAAQAAIAEALAEGVFTRLDAISYVNPVRMDDYEAFATRMGLIDPARAALVTAGEETLRATFHEMAEARDGAFHFDQPALLEMLVKPN